MTSRNDDDHHDGNDAKGTSQRDGMPWVEFEEISQREAAREPLDLSPERLRKYEQEKAKAQAIIKPALDNAIKSLDLKIWHSVKKTKTPELDALFDSVRTKQNRLNEVLSVREAEGSVLNRRDVGIEEPANEQSSPIDALVSLTQAQTDALNQLAIATKNSGESQRIFNLAMLLIGLLALVFAAGSLIAAVNA